MYSDVNVLTGSRGVTALCRFIGACKKGLGRFPATLFDELGGRHAIMIFENF